MDFDRLDAILKERGLSRRKLAIAVGILPGTMSTAFSRRSGLSSEDVLKIAQYLKVSPYYLEGFEVKTSPLKTMPGYEVAEVLKDGKRIGETRIIPNDMTGDELILEVLDDLDEHKENDIVIYEQTMLKVLDEDKTALDRAYKKLNRKGRKEAVKRVEELTEIPRYTKPVEKESD